MSANDPAIWALAVSVFALAMTLFFRSPKELHGQLEKRVDKIEDDHNGLALVVKRLETIVDRLERTVDNFLKGQRGNLRR